MMLDARVVKLLPEDRREAENAECSLRAYSRLYIERGWPFACFFEHTSARWRLDTSEYAFASLRPWLRTASVQPTQRSASQRPKRSDKGVESINMHVCASVSIRRHSDAKVH
uniref:Integrase catalytic domain-containing protein n=1 Tax=Ascaris lumbricoides TaxID=6252 RepID=A0A0M3HPW8_ASCLU